MKTPSIGGSVDEPCLRAVVPTYWGLKVMRDGRTALGVPGYAVELFVLAGLVVVPHEPACYLGVLSGGFAGLNTNIECVGGSVSCIRESPGLAF